MALRSHCVLGIARTDPERAEQSPALLNELREQVS
jgi:hypothetical protein